MATFPLKIICPDGVKFQGEALLLTIRTTTGEMGIQPKHINCVAPLGMGRAIIWDENGRRTAACIGGMMSVMDGVVTLLPTTFEWADEIDVSRVDRAYDQAKAILENKQASEAELALAEARLKRAMVRRSVISEKQSKTSSG